MHRFSSIAALVLVSVPAPRSEPSAQDPQVPDRPVAALIPESCSVFVEGSGLWPLLEQGLEAPFFRALLASELGQALPAALERTPAEALALADQWLGAPALPLVADLVQHGLGLGAVAGTEKVVLVAQGKDAERVSQALATVFDRVESALGWPGALDRPSEHWSGAEVWFLGEDGFVARRDALLVLGNDRALVQGALELALELPGPGLLGRPAFAALHSRRSPGAALWAWVDLAALDGAADEGYRELRRADRQPAFQSILGAVPGALASAQALAAEITLGQHDLALELLGWKTSGAAALLPGARAGAVPAELRGTSDVAEALLYRDYASLFTQRAQLFPAEFLPGFAEAITNGALFFEGQDLGEEVLSGLSPWLRFVARDLEFAAGRKPEIPLPGLAVVAVLEKDGAGEQWVSAFQTLIAILNVDQAQKGEKGLRLHLGREGEVEISSARFAAPGPADGVDVRYNLEPALAVVGRHLVLGTHEFLVRELVRELEHARPIEEAPTAEFLELDTRGLARLVGQNLEALVAQKMLDEGLPPDEARREIERLRLALGSLAGLRVEAVRPDGSSPELRAHLGLAQASPEKGR